MSRAPLAKTVHPPQRPHRWRTLPHIKGLAPVAARTLSAEFGDLRQYKRNELVALAGLFPKHHQSGSSVRKKPRLAKGGGRELRRVLFNCARSVFDAHGPWQPVIQHYLKRGMEPMAVIGVLMRKLLLVARAVMLHDGHYDPSKISSFRTAEA